MTRAVTNRDICLFRRRMYLIFSTHFCVYTVQLCISKKNSVKSVMSFKLPPHPFLHSKSSKSRKTVVKISFFLSCKTKRNLYNSLLFELWYEPGVAGGRSRQRRPGGGDHLRRRQYQPLLHLVLRGRVAYFKKHPIHILKYLVIKVIL